MPFDTLIANPGRLRILTALAVENRQDFVHLRKITCLTDGNLSAHARRLHIGGMIDIEKKFRDGKPVTTFQLTAEGRQRLADHARALLAAVEEPAADTRSDTVSVVAEEDWID